MGEIRIKQPVLPIFAAFAAEEESLARGLEMVQAVFGELFAESETFRFDAFTDYYEPSMGAVLYKKLWAFRDLVDAESLAAAKIQSNAWEEAYAEQRRGENRPAAERPLNLDPGYIDLGKLVLASTKDHSHRIYLQKGIFAEVTLIYTKKHWQPLPWTYPDYQSPEYQRFFDKCREYLRSRIQKTN